MFAKSRKPAYAQILSPLASPSASLAVEGNGSAEPALVVNTPELVQPTQQEEIEKYIKTIFGKDAKTAIAVSRNECGPTNKSYPSCQFKTAHENSIGLFQINIESATTKVHWSRIPGETLDEKVEWLKNPHNNTLMAFWIFTHSGFNPWTAFTSGNYLKDM